MLWTTDHHSAKHVKECLSGQGWGLVLLKYREDLGIGKFAVVFGIPWSETQFISKAVNAGHPKKLQASTPEPLKHALMTLAGVSDEQVASHRSRKLKEWVNLAHNLEADEQQLKESLRPDVCEIVKSKRLLLWETLLKSVKYPDMGVVAEMKATVQLTGDAEITPNFRPMSASQTDVRARSDEFRDVVLRATVSQGELDATVLEKTHKEKEKGWLIGPLPLSSIPTGCLISRRFGIQPGSKVRLIDDFSQSGVNHAVQSYEAPQPQRTDVIASIAHSLLQN